MKYVMLKRIRNTSELRVMDVGKDAQFNSHEIAPGDYLFAEDLEALVDHGFSILCMQSEGDSLPRGPLHHAHK